MTIKQLGYVGLNVGDIEAWRRLAGSVLGLEVREPGGAGEPVYMRLDEHHHRLAFFPSDRDEFAYIGWEVSSAADLDALADRLSARGIEVRQGTDEEAGLRKVTGFIAFRDPEGFPLEVYYGPLIDDAPLKPGRQVSGFNAGSLGLGHLMQVCKDPDGMADLYVNEFGFRVSDHIDWDDAHATFLHCNPRHHSLALVNECFGMKGGQVHHMMIETTSLDDVGRAYDLIRKNGIPLALTLGRHTNDHMTSFYCGSPSGFAIEYGWGGRLIDDAVWQAGQYDSPSIWGHEFIG